MKYLLLIPTIIILAILSMILNGWVLSILWSWFVAPLFGLPLLSIPVAVGIAITVKMLTHEYSDYTFKGKNARELICKAIGHSIFGSLFVLFIGWIVTLFI